MLFLTIGESPRSDLVPELLEIIGKEVSVREAGLMDGVADYSVARPLSPADLLVSRLRNGTQVELSHVWLEERLKTVEVDGPAVILCTGELDDDRFIKPSMIVRKFFEALPPFKSLAVILPDREQASSVERWRALAPSLSVFYFSPYENKGTLPGEFDSFDYVYLDCMGYTLEHESLIAQSTSGIVISARKLVGNFLRCLIS